jgi:hypothetical protein
MSFAIIQYNRYDLYSSNIDNHDGMVELVLFVIVVDDDD